MKLKSIIKSLALMLPLLPMASCSDSDFLSEPASGDSPAELSLTLAIPDYVISPVGSRAGQAPFSSIHVVCYAGAERVKDSLISSGWLDNNDNSYTINVKLHPRTTSLQFVTNTTVPNGINNLSAASTTNPDLGVLWGEAALKDLISSAPAQRVVTLLRQNAAVKMDLTTNPAPSGHSFEITGFGVYATASAGTLAPGPQSPTILDGEPYEFNLDVTPSSKKPKASAIKDASSIVNIFESRNPDARIIVKAAYDGEIGYYPIAFRDQGGAGFAEVPEDFEYTDIDVVRNHLYTVTIVDVRRAGFPTLEEAFAAQPDNRATVMITDTNAGINSITANADYMLGVADAIDGVSCEKGSIQVAVVTNRPGGAISLSAPGYDWITPSSPTPPAPTHIADNSVNPNCYVYSVKVDISANTKQDKRSGTIIVRAGELTRTVTVTQLGVDYKRDNNRKVTMLMNGSVVSSDYFKWLDESLHGVAREDFCQDNIVRNDGLHFPAVPAYTITYRIPKLSGDSNPTLLGSTFSLSTSNSAYYEITMPNQSEPGQTIGTFKVTNASGAEISYPLYRTGWIHQLKDSHASLQRPGGAVTGWFYYELMRAGSYWILDRNLGATSNLPYITTSAALAQNTGATGAYFKVATVKSSSIDSPTTIVSQLGISQFNIPKRAAFEALAIQTIDVTPSGTERTYVPFVPATNISGPTSVYFPNAGYYEDDDLRCETYATLWTRTLVSGNQGFSKDSPDFGYWYQYLNIYGRKVGFSNIRIADGTLGEAPSDESVYKFLPIRLIWE